MTEPIAYLRGEIIPASQAMVSVYDAGFVLGATVIEQMRTFRGEIFRLPEHLQRFRNSLAIAGLKPQETLEEIAQIAERIAEHNRGLIDPESDFGVCLFVTPGPHSTSPNDWEEIPTVGVHMNYLQFDLWAHLYEQGVSLRTTSIRQVPDSCWPPALKCRSRMHYYLADREAQRSEPKSRALLLDQAGFMTETTTANVVALLGKEGLVSPPIEDVLPGISMQVATELAGRLEISLSHRKMKPDELVGAEEVFLTSTPNCMLPVTRFNGKPIGSGKAGPVYQKLLAAWNEMIGFDIAEQARRFAQGG